MPPSPNDPSHPGAGRNTKGDAAYYFMGSLMGVAAGVIDVKLGDLLLTAMFVLVSTMLLGALRPVRPWRWLLLVAVFVPVAQLSAFLFLTQKPYLAQIYESFLGFLTGIAGAYGGSYARRAIQEVFKP